VKHYVRVCRPRFEVTVLEIDADDDDQAEDIAIGEAVELPPEKWHLLAFDDGLYQSHVETCHLDDTIDANVDDPKEREEYIADLVSPERAEATNYIRYLLLLADVAHASGQVIFEPWFAVANPELLESDLSSDWVAELKQIEDEGIENFEDFLSKLPEEPDHLQPIIVPFSWPDLDPEEDPGDRPDPRRYRTEIPELRAMGLSRAEFNDVRACLGGIDEVFGKPQTLSMRLELAAALLAHLCSAAFKSAKAQGHPHDAEKRYDIFERLAVLRARELFKQNRARWCGR
jgi:hypothetical protein